MLYAVYFRARMRRIGNFSAATSPKRMLTLEGDVLADGRYLFRVAASDKASNPGDSARQAELISAPVLFDATPPTVTAGSPQRSGARIEIPVQAVDSASPLRRAEFSGGCGFVDAAGCFRWSN